MNKEQAIDYMIKEVEKIEKDRMAMNLSIDSTKGKKETVDLILKKLEEVQIDDEN